MFNRFEEASEDGRNVVALLKFLEGLVSQHRLPMVSKPGT